VRRGCAKLTSSRARPQVTIDPHPHAQATPAVSIHPCRHAAVVKSLAEQLSAGGGGAPISNDRFLLVFLRFCQTAVPCLEYDYTF